MPLFEVLQRARRRWYVALVVLACALVVAAEVAAAPGVWTTRVEVTLLAPSTPTQPNQLESVTQGLIATAGLVASDLNAGAASQRTSSPDVPLYGLGIREGTSVILPNTGGQWQQSFASPALQVQVVGPTPSYVSEHLDAALSSIDEKLKQLQDDEGVGTASRVTTTVTPTVPVVYHVGGSRVRATAAVVLLGIVLGIAAAAQCDRRFSPRGRNVAVGPLRHAARETA